MPIAPIKALFIVPATRELESRDYASHTLANRCLRSVAGWSDTVRTWGEEAGYLPLMDASRVLAHLRSEFGQQAGMTGTFRRLVEIPVCRPDADLVTCSLRAHSAYEQALEAGEDVEDMVLDAELHLDQRSPFHAAPREVRDAIRKRVVENLRAPRKDGGHPRRASDLDGERVRAQLEVCAQEYLQASRKPEPASPEPAGNERRPTDATGSPPRSVADPVPPGAEGAAANPLLARASVDHSEEPWTVRLDARARVLLRAFGTDLGHARMLAARAARGGALPAKELQEPTRAEWAAWRSDLQDHGVLGGHHSVCERGSQILRARSPEKAALIDRAAALLLPGLVDEESVEVAEKLGAPSPPDDAQLLQHMLEFREGLVPRMIERVAAALPLIHDGNHLDRAQRARLEAFQVRHRVPAEAIATCIDLVYQLQTAILILEQVEDGPAGTATKAFEQLCEALEDLGKLPLSTGKGTGWGEIASASDWLVAMTEVAACGQGAPSASDDLRKPVTDLLWQALQLLKAGGWPQADLLRQVLRVTLIESIRQRDPTDEGATDGVAYAESAVRGLPSIGALPEGLRAAVTKALASGRDTGTEAQPR